MKNIGQISILHVIFLSMTVIGLKNHVTILPPILDIAGRDGWASVIIAACIIFPWLFLLIYIHKKSNQQPIKDWLKQRIGKVGSSIILYITAIYLILIAAFTLRETVLWISSTFLVETPDIFFVIIYILLIGSLISTNVQTFVIVNTFVLFFVVVFGFYVAFVNMQVKEYDLIFPMFEHGVLPALKAVPYPASGFVELILFLFLQQHVKGRIKWYHFAIMLFILVGLTMGPLVGAITEFGPEEAANLRYPAYEEWGLVTIGGYIEHMDFLSIYQWLTGTFIRVGLLLFIAADLLNITGKRKAIWSYLIPPFFIINLILFITEDTFFIHFKNYNFLVSTFIFFVALSFILGMIALTSGKNKQNKVRRSQNTTKKTAKESSDDEWTQNKTKPPTNNQ